MSTQFNKGLEPEGLVATPRDSLSGGADGKEGVQDGAGGAGNELSPKTPRYCSLSKMPHKINQPEDVARGGIVIKTSHVVNSLLSRYSSQVSLERITSSNLQGPVS